MKKLGELLKGLVKSKVEKVRETVDSLRQPPEEHEDWHPPVRGEDPLGTKTPRRRCPNCRWEGELASAAFRLADPTLRPLCPECRAKTEVAS